MRHGAWVTRVLTVVLVLGVAACGPSTGDDDDDDDGPDAPFAPGDNDGDGYLLGEDCNDYDADVHPGASEICDGVDDDCNGTVDDAWNGDGDGFSTCGSPADCNDTDPSIYPGAAEAPNGIDDDCDGIADNHTSSYDDDGDGYSEDAGDCNDDEAMVNPGAVEVSTKEDGTPEEVDNDCDGWVDEPPDPCDGGLMPSNVMDYPRAIELCNNVTAAAFSAGSSTQARNILATFGSSYGPQSGGAMAVLASGIAQPGQVTDMGTEFLNTAPHPDPHGDPGDGCGMADPATVNDYVELALEIDVPSNAKSFTYNFNFMSAEYPEWVCSEFDDTFVAYLHSSAYTGNISYDAMGRPVSINIAFFSVCDVGSEPPGSPGACTGSGPLAGTGYEGGQGGGTGWLTTTSPVTPGEHITLRFIIFDEGDHILDSAVLIDNFRWEGTAVDAPITVD